MVRAWPSHCSDLGEVSLPPSGPHKVTRPRVKVMHERRGQGDAEGDSARRGERGTEGSSGPQDRGCEQRGLMAEAAVSAGARGDACG